MGYTPEELKDEARQDSAMTGTAQDFICDVRRANRIEQVLPELVPDFKGFEAEGKAKLRCLCPFHEGDASSFVVYKDDQYYRCSVCDEMGDVFDLVQGVKGVDFPQALHLLARRARIPSRGPTEAELWPELEIRALQDILGAAADFYYWTFGEFRGWDEVVTATQKDENAIEEAQPGSYAAEHRAQLLRLLREYQRNDNAIREARLGKAPQGSALAEYLARRGFDLELAKKAGVVRRDGSDFFQDRFVTPYFDKGRVVYMSGESGPDSEHPLKGRDLPVTDVVRRALAMPGALQGAGELIIVETYADALTLRKWGQDAVPLAGMALSEQEFRLLRDHKKVYVWFDSGALERATDLGKRIVRQSGVVPRIVERPRQPLEQDDDSPRGCLVSGCEGRLENSQEVLYMMLKDIPSCGGGDWENAVREFFGCLCCLSQGETAGWKNRVTTDLNITNRDFDEYVKASRRREMRSQGGRIDQAASAGDEPPGSFLEIHPALDYAGEDGVVSVALEAGSGDRVLPRAYLITSSREKLALDGQQLHIKGKPVLFRSKPRAPDEERWSRADIERFLEGDDPQPSQTFARLLDIVRRHIDFKEAVHAEILAVWCMGSYLFPLFGAYPYLHLYGLKGTGKTQTMTLASKVAFNMVLTTGITPASTFRLVQSLRCCLGLDEAEDLRLSRDHDGRGLLRFLRAGYKKGASVIRTEGDSVEGFRPRRYDVYSPKMIATMGPVEDILGSRCISINMLRTKDPQIGGLELSDDSEDWPGMRHALYCFALNHFREVRQIYHDEAESNVLLNRDHELWRPLFAVAKLLDQRGADGVWERLVEYAVRVSQEDSSIALEDFDVVLIRALESLLGRDAAPGRWIYAEDIGRIIRRNMRGEYLPKQVTQKIGYSLRNLGLLASPRFRKRSASQVTYYIRPEDVRDIRERYGIESVQVEPPVPEPLGACPSNSRLADSDLIESLYEPVAQRLHPSGLMMTPPGS